MKYKSDLKNAVGLEIDTGGKSGILHDNQLKLHQGAFLRKGTLQGQNRDETCRPKKHRFMKDIDYRTPVIRKYSDKWFIEYYYRCPADLMQYGFKEWQRFKVYEDINRFKGEEKDDYAKKLLEATIHGLEKENYNPFDELREEIQKQIKARQNKTSTNGVGSDILLVDALKEFKMSKIAIKASENTISSYEGYINNFKHYLFEHDKLEVLLKDFKIEDFKEMLTWLQHNNSSKDVWSASTYNNHLAFVGNVINWCAMKPRKWVDSDDYTIGHQKEIEYQKSQPVKNQHFNGVIYDRVVKELNKLPKLLFYSKFIYYSCMRPDEIRKLKIEHVDLRARIIKMKGKTGYRVVPICDELHEMLESLNLENYPVSYFVIGSSGNVSNKEHSENYFSEQFRMKVRKPLEIGDNYTNYGWKHTRVIDLIMAGFKDYEVMQLTGHTDTESFDAYKRDLMGRIDPKMKGKTISFQRNG